MNVRGDARNSLQTAEFCGCKSKTSLFAFVSKTKYVCLSFILDLVSSGSSGSVKSWDQCYCSWYAKMNLWSRARPRNLAPLPSPGADWLPQHSSEHPCVSKCLTIQGHLAPRGVKRGKGQLAPASLENVEWWILKSVFPVSWTL